MNIVWIIIGFIGGVIISRNAAEMDAPSTAAALAAMVAGCGIAWTAAYHGKRQAVASAVATATATATAKAQSEAAAMAQSVVNLYGSPNGSPDWGIPIQRQVTDTSRDRDTASLTQGETDHGQQLSDGRADARARRGAHRRGIGAVLREDR